MELPKDPMLLLSVINTKLRDYYDAEKEWIINTLKGMDYEYDESRNQFI